MSQLYDKPDDFDFDIVNFPFLDGDVPNATSYEFTICLNLMTRIARASIHVSVFNNHNKLCLNAQLLKQCCRYRTRKPHKTFPKFHHYHFDLTSKYKTGLKQLLQQNLPEPVFYGDLLYKLRRVIR